MSLTSLGEDIPVYLRPAAYFGVGTLKSSVGQLDTRGNSGGFFFFD